MEHSNYKIIDIEINNYFITITYISLKEPIPYSLYKCSYSKKNQESNTLEFLQFCMKTEEFVEISGMYSQPLQKSIRDDLLHSTYSFDN